MEAALRDNWPTVEYLPVDPAWYGARKTLPDLQSVSPGSIDVAVLAFTLHDVADQGALLHQVASCVREGGHIALLDLSDEDLPAVTRELRSDFHLRPRETDHRLSPGKVARLATAAGLEFSEVQVITRTFTFETAGHFAGYVRAFGLDTGQDLPWTPLAPFKTCLDRFRENLPFPFRDTRVFLSCLLTKHSTS